MNNDQLVENISLIYHCPMANSTVLHATAGDSSPSAATKSRSLLAACLTHALHDGYTDGLYAFLPVWQAQFGLSYAGLATVHDVEPDAPDRHPGEEINGEEVGRVGR